MRDSKEMRDCSGGHPIEKIMAEAMAKLKGLVDVNTVIGSPVTLIDGQTLIPISKVGIGFVAGGGEYGDKGGYSKRDSDYPFSGGSGAGISVTPLGFLLIQNGQAKMISIESATAFDKLFDVGSDVIKNIIKTNK